MEQEFRHILQQDKFVAGSELLLGVSGGIDSVVLLDLLMRVAPDFELKLRVLHLDHLIRPESAGDAEFVMRLCRELGVPCQVVTVDVAKLAADQRISLEAAGRDARREALTCLAQKFGCARIVLAHHRDDQAETLLQRLLRGTGLSGLQAMRMRTGLWWRPLLNFSRQQILDYATAQKLEWSEDASNCDPAFLRNRIRHQLIPHLLEYNPQIVERLETLSR